MGSAISLIKGRYRRAKQVRGTVDKHDSRGRGGDGFVQNTGNSTEKQKAPTGSQDTKEVPDMKLV